MQSRNFTYWSFYLSRAYTILYTEDDQTAVVVVFGGCQDVEVGDGSPEASKGPDLSPTAAEGAVGKWEGASRVCGGDGGAFCLPTACLTLPHKALHCRLPRCFPLPQQPSNKERAE